MALKLWGRPTRKWLYRRGPIEELLEAIGAPIGINKWDDDFMGDLFKGGAAPGAYQSTASGTSAATAAIVTGAVGGQIVLDPGTDNAGRSDLSLGLHFQGQLNAVCLARVNPVDAITSMKIEVGFTDVVSGTDAGAVNGKSGNTWNADNAAVVCFDTDDDTNLTLMGVKATTAGTAIDLNPALAAATFFWLGVQLQDDRARAIVINADGDELQTSAWMEDAITETTLLTPWIFAQNRSASQRRLRVDRLLVYQRETTSA